MRGQFEIFDQHNELIRTMEKFFEEDRRFASELAMWRKKKPIAPISLKNTEEEQKHFKKDSKAAYQYLDKLQRSLADQVQAAKLKASNLVSSNLIETGKRDDLFENLNKRKEAFEEQVRKLAGRERNSIQEQVKQFKECCEIYQNFLNEVKWVDRVEACFKEIELKFKARFPNKHAELFAHIKEGLKKLYVNSHMTALKSEVVFDHLCRGLNEDNVDPDMLLERCRDLQEGSVFYDEIIGKLGSIFENYPEQATEVEKKLKANLEKIVLHYNEGGKETLRRIKAALDEVEVIFSDSNEAQQLAGELIAPITKFVSDLQDKSRRQRRGVHDFNADPSHIIHTKQFHGFKEEEFRSVLTKKIEGETIKTALRLNEEVTFIPYKRSEGGGGELERASAQDKAESIVKVEFRGRRSDDYLDATVYCQDDGPYKKGDIVVTPGPGMVVGLMAAKSPVNISSLESEGHDYNLIFHGVTLEDEQGASRKLCPQQMAYVYAKMFNIEVTCSLSHPERERLIAIAEIAKARFLHHDVNLSDAPAPAAAPPSPSGPGHSA